MKSFEKVSYAVYKEHDVFFIILIAMTSLEDSILMALFLEAIFDSKTFEL